MSGNHDDAVDDVIGTMATADALFVRCELVVIGQQPLTSFNSAVEQFIHEVSTDCR